MNRRLIAWFCVSIIVCFQLTFAVQLDSMYLDNGRDITGSSTARVNALFDPQSDGLVANLSKTTNISGVKVTSCGEITLDTGEKGIVCYRNVSFNPASNPNAVSIKYNSLDNDVLTTKSGSFLLALDTTAPAANITNLVQIPGSISFTITAKDTVNKITFTPTSANAQTYLNGEDMRQRIVAGTLCGGLSRVDVFVGAVKIGSSELSGCSATSDISLSLPTTLGSGMKSFKFAVYDAFGNNVVILKDKSIILDPPSIYAMGIYSGATLLTFFKDSASAKVIIDQSGADIAATTITVTNVGTGSDVDVSTLYRNGSKIVGDLTITQSGTYEITIDTTDAFGNHVVKKATQVITSDSIPPTVESISSTTQSGGKTYVGSSSTITARIFEANSGLRKEQVFLSGAGINNLQGDCVQSADRYICTWNNVAVTSATNSVILSVTATDDVGNIGQTSSQEFVFDATPPVITGISWSGQSPTGDLIPVVAAFGKVVVSVTYTDESPVSASIDFSALGAKSPGSTTTVTCEKTNCLIISPNLGAGLQKSYLRVVLTDVAGNSASRLTENETRVLPPANISNISFFETDVSLSPAKFDMATSEYLKQRSFAQVKIKPANGYGEAKVLSTYFADKMQGCKDARTVLGMKRTASDLRFFDSIKVLNTGDVSTIVLAAQLKAAHLDNVSEISIICDIQITGEYANTYISSTTQKVLLNFSTYSLAVGEIGANYNAEVARTREDISGSLASKLKLFKKLFELAEKFCKIYGVLKAAMVVFQTIRSVFGHTADATAGTPFFALFKVPAAGFCASAETVDMTVNYMPVAIDRVVGPVCAFVNCQWSLTGAIIGGISKSGFSFKDALGSPGGKNVPPSGGFNSVQGQLAGTLTSKFGSPDGKGIGDKVIGAAGFDKMDTKNNLFLSVINLCIPGVIHNLEVKRQIECRYLDCITNDVPQGLPMSACAESKAYSMCVYEHNQLYGMLPFLSTLNWLMDQFKALLSDPFAMTGAVLGGVFCGALCTTYTTAQDACKYVTIIKQLGSIMGNVNSIISIFDKKEYPNVDYCKEVDL